MRQSKQKRPEIQLWQDFFKKLYVSAQVEHYKSWWNKDSHQWVTQTTVTQNAICPEVQPGLLLIFDARHTAWFFIRKHYLRPRGNETHCNVCRGKIQNKSTDLLPISKCLHTHTHRQADTHRRVEHHSREMAQIHFVRRNRTNFGSEPELMSRSLMCKSSSPTAKPIQSTHNPAQVQLCSLLHY